ncbi:glycosyltransferase [Tenacibaculum sp. IB213877]|uniref:glycosyltransferase n=1 Tax=Tenacibaculum sp. IB213877 TaxID=3097351 RepID=UPI002A59D1BB|nr:glycosyltransferase [Tenacibaculum sp. IB213877]MDY0781504.1 glycosyltransferase [Tenacibaculum sp. IB213877]
MKLAIVTAFPPSKVTLNEYGYHLVKHFRLKEKVEEIILITDKTVEDKHLDYEGEGCKITVKNCWEFNSYKNIFSIYKAINQTKPDAILFNLQFLKFGDKKIPAALGLMLPMLFKMKGIPTIALLHNILEQVDLGNAGFTENRILQRVYNFIGTTLTKMLLSADLVAVTIHKYVNTLQNKYKKNNVVLIPHGTFETPPQPDFSLPAGPKKIMAFGKFGTYKKVEVMIEAVEKIRQRTNEALEIVIAGTDSPNTPGYLDSVKEKYAQVPGLIFTGYVDEKDVPVIFGESTVVVFPYTSTTGSSGVLHQAGSYGKAVVMPNLGDLTDLVRDEGYIGEFFKADDVNSLADAIQNIVTNDAFRLELAKANYEAASAYPMGKIADMYLNHFQSITRKKHLSESCLLTGDV